MVILVSCSVVTILCLITCIGCVHVKAWGNNVWETISYFRYGVLDHRSKSQGVYYYFTWFTISRFTFMLMAVILVSLPAWCVVAVLAILLISSAIVHTLLWIFSTYFRQMSDLYLDFFLCTLLTSVYLWWYYDEYILYWWIGFTLMQCLIVVLMVIEFIWMMVMSRPW